MIKHLKFHLSLFKTRNPHFSESKKNVSLGMEWDFADLMKLNKNLVADKTILIQELLRNKCNYLITRPRRMGKTFNLSMLKVFFDKDQEHARSLFQDTFIGSNKEIMDNHMSKYPVISISLNGF